MSLLSTRFARFDRPGEAVARPHQHRRRGWRPAQVRGLALVGIALAGLMGEGASAAPSVSQSEVAVAAPAGPGASFATVEAAALDALAWATRETGPADRGRVRVGAIQRRPDGRYVYRPPSRSQETLWRRRPPVLRFSLRADDVASYVLYPKTGTARVDRRNEQPSAGLRRMVDETDPEGRPLYLLTPSLRVVRYAAHATYPVAGRGMIPLHAPEQASVARAATLVEAVARTWRALFARPTLTTASR